MGKSMKKYFVNAFAYVFLAVFCFSGEYALAHKVFKPDVKKNDCNPYFRDTPKNLYKEFSKKNPMFDKIEDEDSLGAQMPY